MKTKQSGFILLENMVAFLLMLAIIITFAGTVRWFNQIESKQDLKISAYLAAAILKKSQQSTCQIDNDWYTLPEEYKILNVTQNLSYEI